MRGDGFGAGKEGAPGEAVAKWILRSRLVEPRWFFIEGGRSNK